jgi:hypothetical protein
MTELRAFLYVVTNMYGCAIGGSEYKFSCVVYALTQDEAHDWGNTVAIRYASKFGLPPHEVMPSFDEILHNSNVFACDEPEGADHVCAVGEFPTALQSDPK